MTLEKISASHMWFAIQHLAHTRGVALSDLERRANLPPNSLIEPAEAWPSLDTLFAVLEAMGATLCDFAAVVDRIALTL